MRQPQESGGAKVRSAAVFKDSRPKCRNGVFRFLNGDTVCCLPGGTRLFAAGECREQAAQNHVPAEIGANREAEEFRQHCRAVTHGSFLIDPGAVPVFLNGTEAEVNGQMLREFFRKINI